MKETHCTAIKVGRSWIAGYIHGVAADGSPLLNDCASPFNGLRFKTRNAAELFIMDNGFRVVRSYNGKLTPEQVAVVKS